jgi:hypothetical protein
MMAKNVGGAWRVLALAGTVIVWLPLGVPILFAVVAFLGTGQVRFDWLMPAELFWLALAGGGLLIAVALRAHRRQGLVIGSFCSGIALLALSQAIAVASGIASGESAASGIWWALSLTFLAAYQLGILLTGCGGLLLLRDFRKE